MSFDINNLRIGVIGLGYVGLPLAVEFGKTYPTVGFDVNAARIAELTSGVDSTLEASEEELRSAGKLRYATEFFAPLYPADQADMFLSRLKRLQDVFGYLNDVAMAQDLPKALAREGVSSKPKKAVSGVGGGE